MSTNISNLTQDIGGFPYILNYLGIFLPYSILSIVGIIVGVTGNALIISAVLVSKELRKNSTCILITNLALADLTISLFANSGTVSGVFAGKAYFDQHMAFCIFFASICLVSCGTSLLTMEILAINRYICIFYNQHYSTYFSMRNTLIGCVSTWIIACLLDVPNFIPDVGGHVYDIKTMSCLFDRLKVAYTVTISITCIITPCCLVSILYMRIFCHAFHAKSKVRNSLPATHSNYRNTMEAVKIAKSLFASFFLFSACWIPLSIIYIVGKDEQLPIPAHVFTNLPAHLNSAVNPIFYGIYNPKMRQGYKNLCRLITCNRYFASSSVDESTKINISKKHIGLSLVNSLNMGNKNIQNNIH